MQKQGYRESTIRSSVSALKSIARNANLLNPEGVKGYLARAEFSESRKEKLTWDLARFYNYKHIPFEKPHYRRLERLPFIPLEGEVDQLISGVGGKTAVFLQLLKETGIRAGEAWNLRWVDVDSERNILRVLPEKNSKPRQCKVSSRLLVMLNRLSHASETIFRNSAIDQIKSMNVFRRNFERQRGRVATRIDNARLLQISFRTLRHFKATMEYHRTKDILHVMQLLGHKNIRNTLVYTHMVNFESDDDYVCKVAKTVEEAKTLIETGFEFVTDFQDAKLFRKRK
jgi:integrase